VVPVVVAVVKVVISVMPILMPIAQVAIRELIARGEPILQIVSPFLRSSSGQLTRAVPDFWTIAQTWQQRRTAAWK
jgi:hypothetical protein